jgi:Arc/MetJ-type ribon-helix-helix transcriptional regulator
MRPYLRPAPHSGRCKKCGHRLGKGEHVYYAKHWGMACEQCGGSETATPAPRKTKRSENAVPTGTAMTGEKPARKCSDGVWRYEFGSVSEAVRDALDDFAQNDTSREHLRNRMARALSGQDSWGNYFTQDRFLRELSKPSKHLLEAVDRMRERLIGDVAAPTTPRRKVRRGQDWGEELDVDRYLSRDPSPWDRSVREKQPRRTVTIGCNLTVNAGVKPEELLYRGAAALALADVLTSRGVNVGIVAFDSVHCPTDLVKHGVVRYTLKDPLMPLDLGAITFALCEIAFFRVVGAVGGSRHWPGRLCHSLGSAANLPAADRTSVDYLVDADVLGEEQATEWLKGCLATTETEVCHV